MVLNHESDHGGAACGDLCLCACGDFDALLFGGEIDGGEDGLFGLVE